MEVLVTFLRFKMRVQSGGLMRGKEERKHRTPHLPKRDVNRRDWDSPPHSPSGLPPDSTSLSSMWVTGAEFVPVSRWACPLPEQSDITRNSLLVRTDHFPLRRVSAQRMH